MFRQDSKKSVKCKSLRLLGFDGYCVSEYGEVYSKRKSVEWKARRLVPGKGGYLYVQIRNGSKVRTMLVHRLVLTAFVGKCPDGMEGCHIDGDPSNNCLSNLKWDTPKNNCLERGNYGVAVLSEKEVKTIRVLYASGKYTMQQLSDRFGVSIGTVHPVIHRRTWQHVV